MTSGDRTLSVIHVELAFTNYQVFCLYLGFIQSGLQYARFVNSTVNSNLPFSSTDNSSLTLTSFSLQLNPHLSGGGVHEEPALCQVLLRDIYTLRCCHCNQSIPCLVFIFKAQNCMFDSWQIVWHPALLQAVLAPRKK